MRTTGISIIGDAPWGTHFCQFYRDKQDLIDILVPYFKAGLEHNEFCMWVTSEPLRVQEAKAALAAEVGDLAEYLGKGQLEILDYSEWYTPGGRFDAERVLSGWVEKLETATRRGFDGLRLTGNTFWLEKQDWQGFTDYEAMVDGVIGRYRMMAICTYSLAKCGALEIMDVVSNHAFALIKRAGAWQVIENGERRRMEASLHQTEEQLRRLNAELEQRVARQTAEIRRAYELLEGVMGGTTDKIAAQDTQFRYTSFNRAYQEEFKKIFGVDLQTGMSMIDALAHLPEDQGNAVALWGRALRGEAFTLEHDFGDPGRERNCYELHFFPIRNRDGKITGAAHIGRDATARRRAEEALKEVNETLERRVLERTAALAQSEERLRLAALAAEIGVWSWTPGTSHVVVSANWRRLFGVPPHGDVTFETWRDALHPDDRQRVVGELRAASDEHREFHTEYRVVRPDGATRWIVDRGGATYGENGQAIGMAGVNVDITDRKRAEEALRQQREWLRVTLTSIGDAVMAADTSGRITFINPVAAALTGWTAREALHRPVGEVFRIVNEHTGDPAEDIVGRVLRDGRVVMLANDTALLARGGHVIPIEDSAAPIADSQGQTTGVVLVFHDVTEKRRAQEALRGSERRVRMKLESILSPEGDIGNLELGDIIDVPAIQALMEDFYRLARIPMSIVDLKGKLLVGVGWQDICSRFHRRHPEAARHCIESDTELAAGAAAGECKLYKCKNNLWDMATPIMIGGQHAGYIFLGQFFFAGEEVDRGVFREQAERYSFEQAEYLAALERVPRLSKEQIETGMAFFMKLGQMLSLLSYSNIKLARSLAERDTLMKSLRESEERLNRAQEIAHLGSWELDVVTGQLTWSDEVYRIFGLPPREFRATYEAFLEAVHPEDRAAVDAAYSGSLREGRLSYEITHRVLRKDAGEVRWVHEKCEHTADAAGRIVRSTGMVQDITERKRAEEALQRSEALYRGIARNLPGGCVYVVDQDMRVLVAEGNLMARIGQNRESVEGRTLRDAFGKHGFGMAEERCRRALAGESDSYEGEHAGIALWSHYVPLRDESGRVVGAMSLWLDITERKRVEEQLRHAQKLESIGVLAGGIAHDFNNLLVGVIGNASLAADTLTPDSPAVEILGRVIECGEQAAHLTRQMLAYAGKGRFVLEPVNLSAVVRHASALIQSSLPKKVAVGFDLAPDLPAVETDPSQMQQVFMNLALNAGEAIGPNPGAIAVATGEQIVDPAHIRANLEGWGVGPGRYVFLEVRDTGSGMEPATRARIFDPFFTTKFQGRGLGLAAVAGIVRAHRGAIQVTSAPGAGSTFRVLLPAIPWAAAPPPRPARPEADLHGKGTVLVVDDEPIVRELARRSLERQGYEVLIAESGPDAIEAMRSAAARIRLVVLDLSMPGMSGEETLPHLREIKPDLPVIVSSGYSETEALRLFEGTPVSGFIQKPYTVQDIARQVKAALP